MQTVNLNFRVPDGDWTDFVSGCKAIRIKHSDLLRERIEAIAAGSTLPVLQADKTDDQPMVPKGIALGVGLKAKFEIAAAEAGIPISSIVRALINEPLPVLPLAAEVFEPVQMVSQYTAGRCVVATEKIVPAESEYHFPPVPFPVDVFDGFARIPSFLQTNLSPPNSTHGKIFKLPIVGIKNAGCYTYTATGELLSQKDISIYSVIYEMLVNRPAPTNRLVGVKASDIINKLNYKSRGGSAYLSLKKHIYRLRETKISFTDSNGFEKYDAPMLLAMDYTGDLKEGEKYSITGEYVINGEKMIRDKDFGRLDRFTVEIPVSLLELFEDKRHHACVPIESRRCGYSEMAEKISLFLCTKWHRVDTRKNPNGFVVSYKYLRRVFGMDGLNNVGMRMDKFINAVNSALDEMKAQSSGRGGISGWAQVDLLKGPGVVIYRGELPATYSSLEVTEAEDA